MILYVNLIWGEKEEREKKDVQEESNSDIGLGNPA